MWRHVCRSSTRRVSEMLLWTRGKKFFMFKNMRDFLFKSLCCLISAPRRAKLRHQEQVAQRRPLSQTGNQEFANTKANLRPCSRNHVFVHFPDLWFPQRSPPVWELHLLRPGAQQSVRGRHTGKEQVGMGTKLRTVLLLDKGHR